MKKKNLLLTVSLLSLTTLFTSCGGNKNPSSETSSSKESSSETSSSEEVVALEGDGSKEKPYILKTKEHLKEMQTLIDSNSSAYFELGNSIDFNHEEWVALGSEEKPFEGSFNGNGFEISNLKISEFNQSIMSYGFFGYTSLAKIYDLSLNNVNINLNVYGSGSLYVLGGLIGLATNTYVEGVNVSYEEFKVKSLQNSSSYLYAGGLIGFSQTEKVDEKTYYVDTISSSVEGNIVLDTIDASSTVSALGGLIGLVSTGQGSGLYAINSCYYHGDLKGGTYVGGLTSQINYLSSIVDSYAYGSSIEATDKDGSYAAGIVAYSGYETAVLNTYSHFEKITACNSESSVYKSYAGEIVALTVKDGYDQGANILGAGLYNNYAHEATLTADITTSSDIAEPSTSLFSEKLMFSPKVWDLSKEFPLLKNDVTFDKATVTFNANYSGGTNQELQFNAGEYDASVAIKADEVLQRSQYSFNGYTYDKEGKVSYRFYAPMNHDMTLYASWTNLEPLLGNYHYACEYSGNIMSEGNWKFDEDYFYWLSQDYSVTKYRYHFNGEYIFVDELIIGSMGESVGAYEGEIFIFNNGEITAYDVNDNNAIYKATKVEQDLIIPNYEGQKMLGTWYNSSIEVSLYKEGDAKSHSLESTVDYYGGFKVEGNQVNISVWGKIKGTYTYDEQADIMFNESDVLTRTKERTVYATSTNSLRIVVTEQHTYVIENNEVSVDSLTGALEENQEIEISGKKYIVKGNVLEEKNGQGGDIDTPIVEEKSYYGTWTGKVGVNDITIILNSDGTGSYGDTKFTYKEENGVITTDCWFIASMTYNKDNQSLSVSYDDYDFQCEGTLTDFVKEEKVETIPSFCGTWTGKVGVNNITIILNSDGTGSYGDTKFTYKEENGVITTDCWFIASMTYNKDNQSLSVSYDDYDFQCEGTLTDFVKEENQSGGEVTSIEGTYKGTWGTQYTSSCTLVLNSDGTGEFSNEGGVIFTFNYVLNDDGTLTITNFVDNTYCYENLRLSYNVETNGIEGYVYENHQMMTDYTITLIKE